MRTPFRKGQIAIAALLVFVPVYRVNLFGQAPRDVYLDPSASTDDLWDASAQPITERESVGAQVPSDWPVIPAESNPPRPVVSPGASTVSAEELRHPVSGKGRKLLDKARRYALAGDDSRAIAELKLALKEPSAVAYAHGYLGTEYLKRGQTTQAIEEIEQAIALLPHSAVDHSNLGYALCVHGQTGRGLQEIETALSLDQHLLKAHFLKGVILMDQGSHDSEAWENLQLAQKEIPSARLALALFYTRHGQSVAAQQQLQDFAQLGIRLTLAQAQQWLTQVAPPRIEAAAALGLWDSAHSQTSGQ